MPYPATWLKRRARKTSEQALQDSYGARELLFLVPFLLKKEFVCHSIS